MTINLAAELLPEFAAVRLAVTGAPAGPLEILRTDDNGTHPVRQLADQETTGGTLALVDYEAAFSGPVTYQVLGERTNVVPNPSFEANVSGWNSGGGRLTLARWTDGTEPEGTYHLRGTANVAVGTSSGYVYPASVAANGGEAWSCAAWVRPSVTGSYRIHVRGMDAGLYITPYIEGTTKSCPAGVWTRLEASGTLPAAADAVNPLLFCLGTMAIGDYFEVDGFQLVQEPEPGPYIEGTVEAIRQATVNLPLTTPPTLAVVGDPARAASVVAVTSYSEISESGTRLSTIYAGGSLAIVAGLELRQGSVGLHVETYAEAKQLRAILAPGVIAQLRQATYSGLDLYLAVERVRVDPAPVDASPAQWIVTLDYAEREWPTTPLETSSTWTWDDLEALCPTWDDVAATFPTWFDLAVGP